MLDFLHTEHDATSESLTIQAHLVHSQNRGPRSYAAIHLRELEARCRLLDVAIKAVQADYPHVAENPHVYAKAWGRYE